MSTLDRDISEAIHNLQSVSRTAVPRASAQAVNRIATRAISHSIRETSKEKKIKGRLLKRRVKLFRANARKPVATVRVRRGDVPAISIAKARIIKRRKNKSSEIKVGSYRFKNAFIQKLRNGRWHILQRKEETRYPIKVCKVPISLEITTSFRNNTEQLMQTDMNKELRSALTQQLRLVIRRGR